MERRGAFCEYSAGGCAHTLRHGPAAILALFEPWSHREILHDKKLCTTDDPA
jgi:hypothetical protein